MYLSISKKILAWYKKHQRKLPWRKYKSQTDRHYKVLLSEFMLQQTQVKTAIPYFNNFYKNIDSLEKLSKVSQSRVNKLWQGLGYYRRAKYLLETSRIISKEYNGFCWQVLDWNKDAINFYKKFGSNCEKGWLNCSIN